MASPVRCMAMRRVCMWTGSGSKAHISPMHDGPPCGNPNASD